MNTSPNFLVVFLKLEPVFSFFSFDWASASQFTFVHQPLLQHTVTDCSDHLKSKMLMLIGLWQQQACSSLFLLDFDARRAPLREKNFFKSLGECFAGKEHLKSDLSTESTVLKAYLNAVRHEVQHSQVTLLYKSYRFHFLNS